MGKLVSPRVFLIGYPAVDRDALAAYLDYTGQADFLETFDAAVAAGISPGEALCSFYAKLCYKSLVRGKNANVTRVRDVRANLENAYDSGHGSVFEHANLNFVVTNCSRIYTHEQVRHRVGVAYSQTSGRYCRLDSIDLVWDPILDGCEGLVSEAVERIETTVYLLECRTGLRRPPEDHPDAGAHDCLSDSVPGFPPERAHLKWVPSDTLDFDRKKRLTSAIRRIAPNGQSNEMGMSLNIRAIRQTIQVRTAAAAEREIREIFSQVYYLIKNRFPTIFHGARTRPFDGLPVVYGMKTQPYELPAGDPAALQFFDNAALQAELARRGA